MAKGSNFRSARTGRFLTACHGRSHPRTTVRDSVGKSGSSGPHYRSAISGRYVTTKHGKATPNTTVRER